MKRKSHDVPATIKDLTEKGETTTSATKENKDLGVALHTIEELIKRASTKKLQDAAIELFDSLMVYAYEALASDIHIEPWEGHARIRLRIDGILSDAFQITPQLHIQLIARLKILTKMRTDEHSAPQDGRFSFSTPDGGVDVRTSVIPTTLGEKAVLRLLSSQSHKLTMEQLGLFEEDLKRVYWATRRPWGMILATGPTGSGKTTTIYAILEVLNKREVNITTIEDPVEFEIPGVNQSQADRVAKLTFATGLRSLLRQDPDIIMVGEIRDQETAKIGINAAMTGHKLLSTLHTNDAATTIPRLIDMGGEPFLVASTLSCAIAQRLVRRVCSSCTATKPFTKKMAKDIFPINLVTQLLSTKESIDIADIKGCPSCRNTGYKGRVGIYEVLQNSPAIQELTIRRANSAQINEVAKTEGMTSIAQDGIRKILNKETTIEELIRVMQE